MTDQLQALKELAEKIKAGDIGMSQILIHGIFGEGPHHFVNDAFDGSLDAAHSLHNAVLGDAGWTLVDDGRCRLWTIHPTSPKILVDFVEATTPARAWLIAIIKAKIQELEA